MDSCLVQFTINMNSAVTFNDWKTPPFKSKSRHSISTIQISLSVLKLQLYVNLLKSYLLNPLKGKIISIDQLSVNVFLLLLTLQSFICYK